VVKYSCRSTNAAVRRTWYICYNDASNANEIFFGRDAVIRNRISTAEWDYIRQRNKISYITMIEKTRSEFSIPTVYDTVMMRRHNQNQMDDLSTKVLT
jgi:hypothetical protein